MNQLQLFMSPPTNWQDFQTLIVEVACVKYDPNSVQEYGRQGQGQGGVDVYATYLDKNIGIQCKETKKRSLSTTDIDGESLRLPALIPS